MAILLVTAPLTGVVLSAVPAHAAACWNTSCDYHSNGICTDWQWKGNSKIFDAAGNNTGEIDLWYSPSCGAAFAGAWYYTACGCGGPPPGYAHEYGLVAWTNGIRRAETIGGTSSSGGWYITLMLGDAVSNQIAKGEAMYSTAPGQPWNYTPGY